MRRRDEQVTASICHIGNAVPIWGLLFAGWLWFHNRETSRYLIAQSRQALYFHGLFLFCILVWMAVKLVTLLLHVLFAPLGGVLDWFNNVIISLLLVSYVLTCFWGAWCCWGGRPFRYPIVGERLD